MFEPNEEEICYCETCSESLTEEIVTIFFEKVASENNPEKVIQLVYELVEISKMIGINEKNYETMIDNLQSLEILDDTVINYIEENSHGSLDLPDNLPPHWKDRM